MSKQRKKQNKNNSAIVIAVVASILLLAVLASVGYFAYATNGFSEDIKTLSIVYDGQNLNTVEETLFLTAETEHRFDVKNMFSFIDKNAKNYKVSVIANPNTEDNFSYTVDGESYNFLDREDYTAGFQIIKRKDFFTFKMPAKMSSVLQPAYADKQVVLEEEIYIEQDYFILVITSHDDKETVAVKIVTSVRVTSVELDKEEILI